MSGLFKTGLHEANSSRGHDLVVQTHRFGSVPVGQTMTCLRCGREFDLSAELERCSVALVEGTQGGEEPKP